MTPGPRAATGDLRLQGPGSLDSPAGEAGRLRWMRLLWLPMLAYAGYVGMDAIAHGYFDVDDFHNIYWSASQSGWRLVLKALLPWPTSFRPAGLLLYRGLSRAAGLDPVPYHAALLLLNLTNAALVYRVARRMGTDERGVFASSLYLLPVALISTFWKFGEIFEILSTALFLVAFWAFLSLGDGWRKTGVVALLFVLACRAKEMAITLPAVLLAYDLCMAGGRARRRAVTHVTLFSLALVLAAGFRTGMPASPTAPYHLDTRPRSLIESGAWYAHALWPSPRLNEAAFVILALAVLAVMLTLHDRLLTFAALFVPVTFLPVIFLTNHRFGFYWYLPSFGLWLWLGRLTEIARDRAHGPILRRVAEPGICLALLAGVLAGGARTRGNSLRRQRSEAARFRRMAESAKPCPAGPGQPGPDFFPREPPDSARIIYQVICGDPRLGIRRN